MSAVVQIKRINGKPAHRLEGMPAGTWMTSPSEIDAILAHVERQLGVARGVLLDLIEVDAASITRCRRGVMRLQDKWLLRLQQLSGIPVSELLQIACIDYPVQPHANARSAA